MRDVLLQRCLRCSVLLHQLTLYMYRQALGHAWIHRGCRRRWTLRLLCKSAVSRSLAPNTPVSTSIHQYPLVSGSASSAVAVTAPCQARWVCLGMKRGGCGAKSCLRFRWLGLIDRLVIGCGRERSCCC